MSRDSFVPVRLTGPCSERLFDAGEERIAADRPAPVATSFAIHVVRGHDRLECREVHGFSEALAAARDPSAPAPTRLVLVAPGTSTRAWLDRWAEDAQQVRRAVVIRRALDDAQVEVVATLASHGYGVSTQLAIESVRGRADDETARSGVHLRADIEAALARFGALEPDS